jgi:hypothetical protein
VDIVAVDPFHVKPGITAGTGTGTVGDPGALETALNAANAYGLASYHTLLVMTNGADTYSPATALIMPVIQMGMYPCDYSGNPTLNRPFITGQSMTFSTFSICSLMQFDSSPGVGVDFSGSDNSILFGCKITDATTIGVYASNSADRNLIAYNHVIDSGSQGILASDTADLTMLIGNFVDTDGGVSYQLGLAYALNNIAVVGDISGAKGYEWNHSAVKAGICHGNFCVQRSAAAYNSINALTGFSHASAGGIRGNFLSIMNMALGLKNTGTGVGTGFAIAQSIGASLGNFAPDCDVTEASTAAKLAETLNTTDPVVTDHTAQDYLATVDLTSYSYLKTIGLEGTDWIQAGPLPFLGSGGGLLGMAMLGGRQK